MKRELFNFELLIKVYQLTLFLLALQSKVDKFLFKNFKLNIITIQRSLPSDQNTYDNLTLVYLIYYLYLNSIHWNF